MKAVHSPPTFAQQVLALIRRIPSGKVATYGQIASLAGKPHGARGVAWLLHSCSTAHNLPWHRVLNAKGKISFEKRSHNYKEQKRRLENEGVIFQSGDQLNMKVWQWNKQPRAVKPNKNQPQSFG
jgi:methylated-DNA-protein-cysteine methyltransferase-like protein